MVGYAAREHGRPQSRPLCLRAPRLPPRGQRDLARRSEKHVAVIFPRWSNLAPLAAAIGGAATLPVVVLAAWYWFSPKFTDVGYQPEQPVAFSHALHAGDLGMDCRYCHDTVDRAAFAAIPTTQTCMNCHAAVQPLSEALQPVRDSWSSGTPIAWQKVHLLPDYAFFDHSAHLAAGVGCISCHGRIDTMEVVRQEKTLSMSWCTDCHENPWPHLRPRDQVTNMKWDAAATAYDPKADPTRGRTPDPPLHCSGCHR